MYTATDKRCGLPELLTHVHDGHSLAIGGGLSWREPMAALRQLIRQGSTQLQLLGSAHGIDVDLLCGAGCVAISAESYVGFEQDFGMAPNYRRACESGAVQVQDSCCYSMVQQLRASIAGVPFMPMRSIRGSSFLALHPEYKRMICPYTGDELVLVPALKPDIAILHAQYGDQHGNLHIDGPPVMDLLFAQAADIVLATVEQLVSTEELTAMGVSIPYFYVTALSEVPYGAHPTACYPFYAYDRFHTAHYHAFASQGADIFQSHYIQVYILDCATHSDYLNAIGGQPVLDKLASWQHGAETWKTLYE